jgi:hypothetical protein
VSPAPATCERCGRAFECGVAEGACWCGAVDVPAGVRAQMAEAYERCVCPQCLRMLSVDRLGPPAERLCTSPRRSWELIAERALQQP